MTAIAYEIHENKSPKERTTVLIHKTHHQMLRELAEQEHRSTSAQAEVIIEQAYSLRNQSAPARKE